jgi:hypothetical protein
MIRHRFTSNGKPYANSFLLRWYGIVSCRTGNYSPTVSCCDGTESFHVGRETIHQQFPVGMIRQRFTSSRKPYANSFLSSCFDIVSCRIGNYTRKVFCRDETLLSHVGRETIRQQFPVAMVRNRFISDGKLFANSFLLRWYAIVSCRMGNYSPTVFCGDDTPSFHVE